MIYFFQLQFTHRSQYTRSVQKVSSHVIWNIERFIEEDTRYNKYCPYDNDASVPFKVVTLKPHQFSQSPSAAASYFPEFHWWSEISFLSKVILVLGKARSLMASNLGCRGAECLGNTMFHQKTLQKTWCMTGCVVMMKLPITSCS